MSLRDVAVLGGDHDDAVPELLVALVVAKPLCHHVGFADVAARVAHDGLVIAEQEVDPSPLSLLAPEQIGEVGPTRR